MLNMCSAFCLFVRVHILCIIWSVLRQLIDASVWSVCMKQELDCPTVNCGGAIAHRGQKEQSRMAKQEEDPRTTMILMAAQMTVSCLYLSPPFFGSLPESAHHHILLPLTMFVFMRGYDLGLAVD